MEQAPKLSFFKKKKISKKKILKKIKKNATSTNNKNHDSEENKFTQSRLFNLPKTMRSKCQISILLKGLKFTPIPIKVFLGGPNKQGGWGVETLGFSNTQGGGITRGRGIGNFDKIKRKGIFVNENNFNK